MAGDMIRVECECGKAARVPSRYAGRQVKCSGCGGKLTIPDVGASEPGDAEGEAEPTSGGAIGSPVGGRVGSRIGSQGRRPSSSGQVPRRPRSGQAPRRSRSDSEDREGGRGGAPDYGLPAKRRRSASSSANDPYAPPTADVDEYQRRGRGGGDKARDLQAEAHIVAIGIWQRISGVLMIALGGIMVLFMVGGAVAGPRGAQPGMVVGFLIGGVILLGLAALYYQIGVALMNYSDWARIAMVVLFALGCLRVVVTFDVCGAVTTIGYGGAQLWALYGQRGARIFSPGYARATSNDRRAVPWAKSPFFWLPFVLFGLSIVIVIFAVIAGGLR